MPYHSISLPPIFFQFTISFPILMLSYVANSFPIYLRLFCPQYLIFSRSPKSVSACLSFYVSSVPLSLSPSPSHCLFLCVCMSRLLSLCLFLSLSISMVSLYNSPLYPSLSIPPSLSLSLSFSLFPSRSLSLFSQQILLLRYTG